MKGRSPLFPANVHRLLFRVAHAARKQVWKVFRPRVEGVRILALDEQGRVILVRHSYGSQKWMPPGGGLKPGEDAVDAGSRELFEETGCSLSDAGVRAVLSENLHGARNIVHVVVGRTRDLPVPDGREIIAAEPFALDALPESMPAGFAAMIRQWALAPIP